MPQTVRHTLEAQIDQLTREILNATEKAWEAQKDQLNKQNTFWLDEKRKLTEERTELQKKLHQTPSQDDTIKPQTRQEIKERILALNKQAKIADKNMRHALEQKKLSQANSCLRLRNQLNAEVKNLNKLLNPISTTKTDVKSKPVEVKPKRLNRDEIKSKIKDYNKRALVADSKMRIALKEKKLEKANELLQQRNYLNAEAKTFTENLHSAPIITKKKESIKKSTPKDTIDEEKIPTITKPIIPSQQKNTSIDQKTTPNQQINRKKLKDNIRNYNAKARQADKEMRIALNEKRLLDANILLQHRNKFNDEARRLLSVLKTSREITLPLQNSSKIAEKTLSKKELKEKLKTANSNALDADRAMRNALKEKKYRKANKLLKQRNLFNVEAKKISVLLNPPTPLTPAPIEKQTTDKIETPSLNNKPPLNFTTEITTSNNALPQGLGIMSSAIILDKKSSNTQPLIPKIEEKTDKKSIRCATRIAQQIINYRLGFITFFYKKRDIQAQIDAELEKPVEKQKNDNIIILKKALKEHLKHPPKTYVEDHAHNEIILYLLNKVDEKGIAYFNFPEITATNIGAPLKQLRSQQNLSDFIQNYTEEEPDSGSGKRVLLKYFIRDIMQVKYPLTICDLVLQDAIMDTKTMQYGFVNFFDQIVRQANREVMRLQDESDNPLMPKVLRPIGTFDYLGHRDAIQLIPPMVNGIDQYSGAILADTTIQDNIISSSAKLQGIFSTDGAFKNLKIINNKIQTSGEHKITILGMLSGEVTDNTDLKGNQLDIKIQPLRLGGGTPLTNFFVLGFSEGCSYQYEEIKGISGTELDRRSKKVIRGNKVYDQRQYLLDFNMDRFIEHYQRHAKSQGRFHATKDCVEQMLKDGDATKCNTASLNALEQGASPKEATAIAKPKLIKGKPFTQNVHMQQQRFS